MTTQTGDPIESHAEAGPSSGRETETLQNDQAGSPAFDDPDIDPAAVKLLPGTGDPTDDGDVEVDPADIHLPHLPPGRTDARPPAE